MDNARQTQPPWRSWTIIALVLIGLALVQACGKSGSGTGPTTASALQVKLRRAGGAQLPAGCTGGTFTITAPGQPTISGNLGADGQISASLTVGVTYTVTATIVCAGASYTGSTTFTVPPGGATGEIVINVSRVLGVSCSPSTVEPGDTSTCTCSTQSPGPASISWTGANGTGPTATFSSNNPGTYTITCAINDAEPKSTAVTVEEPEAPPLPPPIVNGTVQVVNTSCCTLFAKAFVQPADAQVGSQLSVTSTSPGSLSVAPGSYIVRISCGSDPQFFETASLGPLTVTSGNTTVFSFSGNSICG